MKRSFLAGVGLMVFTAMTVFPSGLAAGSSSGLTINLFTQWVDEQDLKTFYGGGQYCDQTQTPFAAFCYGDKLNPGPTQAYNFLGSPWSTISGLTSSQYVNGGNCTTANSCVNATFDHSGTVASLDTRGTQGPRTVTLDFFHSSCATCGGVPGSPTVFGSTPLATPALVSVFLNSSFTSMSVCSSLACPEAEAANVKLWFNDPNPQLTNQKWRVDWSYVRVLRMSANTWYVIGTPCDGTQVAGLYKLQNTKGRSSTSFQGLYTLAFLMTVVQ